ncbi:MAG: HAMP domain-containing protein [Rhodocyclales bacterium]|nr:HAMP domain-containing protein [Rhodocyclales bacterium]
MKNRSWGIQQRAIFLALAPAAVIAVALTAYFLIVRYADVEEALQNRGQALVRQLAPAAEYGAFSGNRADLARLAQAAAREPDVVSVSIYDAAGQLLANAGVSRTLATDVPTSLRQTPAGNGSVETFQATINQPVQPFDDPFLAMDPSTAQGDKPLGRVVLELSRADLKARKREILGVTLLVTLAVLAAGLLLAHRLGRDIIEPVLALEDAVARIRAGSLDVRIPPHRSGTLVSLETGFNEMATALEASHRRSASALAHSEAELARQLEIAKAKKEEAERASEAKSRFLAAASHDLRQPLHALTLFATELTSSMTKARDLQLASQIVTAAGAMGELLNALLDVSRLDIAAVQPHRQPVALEPLLEMIADSHHQSARAKGLRLRHRPTALWVDTDPQLLRRMIGNLVANAVRYTNDGGVLIGARRHGERVRIEVWDTGIGIDEAHLPYLFHEFYQVANPERDSAKGLGLGLSIVARLGEILDHPVEVLSKPGRGSVFSVSVPVAAPLAPALSEPPPGLPFRPSVMVRLQDIDRCGEICNLLDAWGYERHCACSNDELARLLDDEPAAVICDRDSLPAIAAHLPGRGMPPLLVAIDEAGGSAGEVAIPVDAHLSLPFRPARLRALLHHLLVEDER